MKNIIDLYEASLSSNKLDESSILDIEGQLELSNDDLMRKEIEEKVKNTSAYFIHNPNRNTPNYTIKKVRGKWIVDVNGSLTVFSDKTPAITDGSFQFGRINGHYILSMGEGDTTIKSLQYGPKEVRDDFEIYYGGLLRDLKYCPEIVGGMVYIGNTKIESLKYFPKAVNNNVDIRDNKNLKRFDNAGKCRIGGWVKLIKNGEPTTLKTFKSMKNWDINFDKLNVSDENNWGARD